jgi:hypothetical protein
MLNAVTEMQQDFPQRKVQFDAELGELDSQLNALNNLLGRWASCAQSAVTAEHRHDLKVVSRLNPDGWGACLCFHDHDNVSHVL